MRFFSTTLTLAAVPALVLGATQVVTVGDGGMLAFNPPNITAAVGDQINFEFRAKNHSVTQSTLASPCTMAMFNGSAGVDSGFLALPPNQTFANGSFPTYAFTVQGSGPLWFHCAQTVPVSHCGKGMVFSINAKPGTVETFQTAALASANATDPAFGGATPSGAAAAASSPTAAGTAAASVESSSVGSTTKPNGASKVLLSRGAAGLFTVVTVGAMLF